MNEETIKEKLEQIKTLITEIDEEIEKDEDSEEEEKDEEQIFLQARQRNGGLFVLGG